MLTAGDEVGRSQNGNNNAYCHDNRLTWQPWELEERQEELLRVTRELIRLRRENPALRPTRFGVLGQSVPSASRMDWFNATGRVHVDRGLGFADAAHAAIPRHVDA